MYHSLCVYLLFQASFWSFCFYLFFCWKAADLQQFNYWECWGIKHFCFNHRSCFISSWFSLATLALILYAKSSFCIEFSVLSSWKKKPKSTARVLKSIAIRFLWKLDRWNLNLLFFEAYWFNKWNWVCDCWFSVNFISRMCNDKNTKCFCNILTALMEKNVRDSMHQIIIYHKFYISYSKLLKETNIYEQWTHQKV